MKSTAELFVTLWTLVAINSSVNLKNIFDSKVFNVNKALFGIKSLFYIFVCSNIFLGKYMFFFIYCMSKCKILQSDLEKWKY